MPGFPITRVVLYKHGVGYFEREGAVEGDAALSLSFKQAEVSDILKSLTVLDLEGGHITSVSYDSTKPLEQLLAAIALSIPDKDSLVGLLPQIKGARLALLSSSQGSMAMMPGSSGGGERMEGILLGVDTIQRQTADGVTQVVFVSLLTDAGEVRSFDLQKLGGLEILDPALRQDLDYYLRMQLSAKKKENRTFTFFAQGQGKRAIRLSYTVGAPVWKATYRMILGEEGQPPMIQGWAVVDNTQDEDWENVRLSLVAGLPVSFIHDLYTPRYIRRPVVEVKETTGVLPPEVEEGMETQESYMEDFALAAPQAAGAGAPPPSARRILAVRQKRTAVSSTPTQTRERKLGDLFEYEIEHPVTIRRNQSALVPIVLRPFEGKPVLLYNKGNRAENPMRCVDFENTTGLTLEGGPVTVLEGGSYVGEAMLDTLKPGDKRLVPFAVELSVSVLDSIDSHDDPVHRIVIRRGQFTSYYGRIQQITFHFNNKSDNEQTLYLEHSRQGSDWKLFDTAEPHEITESFWRFKFTLPARYVTKFVVRQRCVFSRSQLLADASTDWLATWLEDRRFLDKKTEKVLCQVVEVRDRAAGFEEQIKSLNAERDTIHQEQKRIRDNLKALGDRASEKELRERFVKTLNGQEDRLEQIEKEVRKLSAERDQCRAQMNALLAELEFETTLS